MKMHYPTTRQHLKNSTKMRRARRGVAKFGRKAEGRKRGSGQRPAQFEVDDFSPPTSQEVEAGFMEPGGPEPYKFTPPPLSQRET